MVMRRLAVALVVLIVAGALILLLRSGARQVPREVDVVSSIVDSVFIPMGDLTVISRPSDCRTDGLVKVALPAALVQKFLEANQTQHGFDLSAFAQRMRIGDPTQAPEGIYADSRRVVISVSRTGFSGRNALVCVEVFGLEERAFFVMLERRGSDWLIMREFISWEAPTVVDLSSPEDGDEEPIFAPRASRIDGFRSK